MPPIRSALNRRQTFFVNGSEFAENFTTLFQWYVFTFNLNVNSKIWRLRYTSRELEILRYRRNRWDCVELFGKPACRPWKYVSWFSIICYTHQVNLRLLSQKTYTDMLGARSSACWTTISHCVERMTKRMRTNVSCSWRTSAILPPLRESAKPMTVFVNLASRAVKFPAMVLDIP